MLQKGRRVHELLTGTISKIKAKCKSRSVRREVLHDLFKRTFKTLLSECDPVKDKNMVDFA